MVWVGIDGPLIRTAANKSSLGGDDQSCGIGIEGFGDKLFGNIRAIAVCGVDEINTQLNSPLQNLDGSGAVFWRSPDAFPGNTHSAITHPADGKLVAQGKIFFEADLCTHMKKCF